MTFTTQRERALVSTDWLAAHLDDPQIRIVDCRHYFDRSGREEYQRGHIPGAVHLNFASDLSDPNHEVEFMMPPAEQVSAVLGRLGIGDDTRIVAYDDEGGHYSSRLWLILSRYGKDGQLRILDGGWTKWTAEGRPVSTEEPSVTPASFTIDPGAEHPEIIASLDDVRRASESGDATILDVRRMSEYTGEEVRAKRGGRVPGAKQLLWQDNLNWDGDRSFMSDEQIRKRHADAGLTPDTPIITYCQGAVRAAHAALALHMAGYHNVRIYDGSWAEWGNRDDVPVETGPPK